MRVPLLGLLLGLAAPLAAALEKPADFATGMPLEMPGQEAFYRLELPLAVHGQARPDLADVRVFNAAGEAVPYALGELPAPAAARPELQPLPYFPVYGGSDTTAGGLDVKIEQSAGGRIIALRSTGAHPDSHRISAYLLDASTLKLRSQTLLLDWPARSEGYNALGRLEASDDLRNWHRLADAPLLDMHFAGQYLQQKRLAFPAGRYRYLRLTADQPLPPLSLAQLEALPDQAVPPPLRWLDVVGKEGDKPGEYRFDVGAHLTAVRLQLVLPEDNTVAPVDLLAKAREGDDWHAVAQAVVFRLRQGEREITSPALEVTPQATRYWLLRVDARAGRLGTSPPVLRLAWTPRQLVFLARGARPFTLAFGQRDATPAQLPLASLLPGYRTDAEARLPEATPQTALALGGHNAPAPGQEDRPAPDWKRWLLWTVLLLGVAVLALMARSLLRQLPPRP